MVERAAHYLFRHYSGLDDNVPRTIDGSMPLTALVRLIRRIIVARTIATEEQEEVAQFFDHLANITLLRDFLIHRGGDTAGELVIAHNIHLARAKQNIEILELKIDDIKAASADCTKIFMKIGRIVDQNAYWAKDADALQWLQSSWQYKPLQPKNPSQPLQSTGRSSRRRRVASRG